MAQDNQPADAPQGTLGTFSGVFTPSILTILGIILFLRLGFVVGAGGLYRALVIIGLANLISILTSISLSAVATNMRVKGGGDYYLISRTLGPAFGGAIGIVLFLAQAISIAFYAIGFGEAVSSLLPADVFGSPRIIALIAISLLFILAWLGADWATRFQYVVMVLLVAALGSFFIGGSDTCRWASILENLAPPPNAPPFWVLFALFFPAVTGFTQGVSMSGDLKDPGRSIPTGTFIAVGVSMVVYLAAALVFSASLPNTIMMEDYGAMKRIANIPALISAGVVAATLSSAMASFLGAPRILQSLSRDRIFPVLSLFAKGHGPSANPRRAVLMSGVIAVITLAMGNLDLIARVVAMFFLISYGLLNYATYFESRSQSPFFRPRFRWFHQKLSLAGALACLGTMLAIDISVGLVAVAVLVAIYQYLVRTAGPARWADSRKSYSLAQIRHHLLAAAAAPDHFRNWRPHVLAFAHDPDRRKRLLDFAQWITGTNGFVSAVQILEGSGARVLRRQAEAEASLAADIQATGAQAFPLVAFAPDLEIGITTVVQAYGIGPVKANTLLFNWIAPDAGSDPRRVARFVQNLRIGSRLGCNVLILDVDIPESPLPAPTNGSGRIDVWWTDDATGQLMLLLAHLVTRMETWSGSQIRALATCPGGEACPNRTRLESLLAEGRIDADIITIDDPSSVDVAYTSGDADLVFLPLRFSGDAVVDPFGGAMIPLIRHLSTTALVLAGEDIELEADPDSGEPSELAAAIDALEAARKRVTASQKAAEDAAEQVSAAETALEDLQRQSPDSPDLAQAALEADRARETAERTARKVARDTAKADLAAKNVENRLGTPSEEEPNSDD